MRTALFTVGLVFLQHVQLLAQPVEPLKTDAEIPKQTLVQLYQRELGPLYKPQQADALYEAHTLIEQFFAQPDKRKELIKSIQATGIDPNIAPLGPPTKEVFAWTNHASTTRAPPAATA